MENFDLKDLAKLLGFQSEEQFEASSLYYRSDADSPLFVTNYYIARTLDGKFVEYKQDYECEGPDPVSKPQITRTFESSEELADWLDKTKNRFDTEKLDIEKLNKFIDNQQKDFVRRLHEISSNMEDIVKSSGYQSERLLKASSSYYRTTKTTSISTDYYIAKTSDEKYLEYEKKFSRINYELISKPKITRTFESSEELADWLDKTNTKFNIKRLNEAIDDRRERFAQSAYGVSWNQIKFENDFKKDPFDVKNLIESFKKNKEHDFGMSR